jgi:hypothetical protein
MFAVLLPCRRIRNWVQKSALSRSGDTSIIVRSIGDDPDALHSLQPDLDIWDAYETIHVVMPDGSMKLGGEAVAEVLRDMPNTKWFASSFAVSIFGFRPFQMVLNLGYAVLADVRPFFGCESCARLVFGLDRFGGSSNGQRQYSAKRATRVRISRHARPSPRNDIWSCDHRRSSL